ncbi:helix-turn-helix domain-containing protein [Paenibacillus athensensis]|uniref:HTH araC/xylS-type domain-containing protein n=1 Tax=Paenibacillus athensensis TaxID=1967502 RepID=A0A4Y8QB06_9BACL|nr:helix-turn-helix domain-containing protein [Paenibacillus athensensis]MCD1260133.1 helix-turn-helix domain-containing protein [Paenibacillus athensensis]
MKMTVITPQVELWRIENGFVNTPHRHEHQYQITVPLYGECRFSHERAAFRLRQGEALAQHPQEEHSLELPEDGGLIIFQVRREALGADEAGGQPGETELALRQSFDAAEVRMLFRTWASALLLSDADTLAVQETEAQILGYLHRKLKGSHSSPERLHEASVPRGRKLAGPATAAPAAGRIADPQMAQVLEYMHAHYTGQMDIDSLAALACRSRYHFIRSFKACLGMSPYQYVLFLRMEEAKRRLRSSDASVTRISFDLGFASSSQFYRQFAKWVGATPEQYRHG